MAINPMQRKARNSFLGGFFIALIIGTAVSFLFYNQMTEAKVKVDELKKLQKEVYVAPDDLKSGDEIILRELVYEYEEDDENNEKNENSKEDRTILEKQTVQTNLSDDELIDASMFKYYYEKNESADDYNKFNENEDEDENEEITTEEYMRTSKKLILKIDVPAGTVITKDMIEEVDEPTSSDQRLQEYNMIILPTLLDEGNYIDIRLKLPTGEDYIVISKKKVYKATSDTVWLKMREDEILTLGNAIVEAYVMTGSKLYATVYTEPGRQEASEITYAVSDSVLNLIAQDKNLINKAKDEINNRYNNNYNYRENRSYRDPVNNLINENSEGANQAVQTGVQEEITKLQTSRQQYVESLQGGTTSDYVE